MKLIQSQGPRLCVAALLLAAAIGPVLASPSRTEPGWEPIPTDYDAFLVARSATRTLPPSYAGNYFSAVSSVNSAYSSLQSRLAADFDSKVKTKIASYGYNASNIHFKLNGPITVNFTWNGSGHDLEVGGFGFRGSALVTGRHSGIGFSCGVQVSASNLSFRGKFDWNQGRALDMAATDPSVNRGVSCETSLSWIPVIGQFADALAEKLALEKMEGLLSVKDLIETKMAKDSVFDMSRLIPAGSLINPDTGLDMGARLYERNALFPNNTVRIRLENEAERPEFVYNWDSYYNASSTPPLPKAQYPVFSVSVQGRLQYGLTLYEERTYRGIWECPITYMNCDAPLLRSGRPDTAPAQSLRAPGQRVMPTQRR